MSLYDYKAAKALNRDRPPFYALIMAAMMRGDSDIAEKLSRAFPDVWAEWQARYGAPGGFLPGEKDWETTP